MLTHDLWAMTMSRGSTSIGPLEILMVMWYIQTSNNTYNTHGLYQFWMFWLDRSKISKIRYIDHYIDHYRSKIRKLILYSYYPLVNSHITMEHHHAIHAKTHYFYGHFQ
jgi:hypothetical protein